MKLNEAILELLDLREEIERSLLLSAMDCVEQDDIKQDDMFRKRVNDAFNGLEEFRYGDSST